MINWRNPNKELPKEGEIVWVIYGHWKQHNPLSYELMSGEVSYTRYNDNPMVQSGDFTGKGSWGIHLLEEWEAKESCDYFTKGESYRNDEYAIAWIPASEFPMPEWTPHDKCYGDKNENT